MCGQGSVIWYSVRGRSRLDYRGRGHAVEFEESPVAMAAGEVIRPELRFDDLIDTALGQSLNGVTIVVYEMPQMKVVTTDILEGVATISDEYAVQGFGNFEKGKSYLVTVVASIYLGGAEAFVRERYFAVHCLL